MNRIKHGDCLQVLKEMSDASIDSLVTDPPAGISFMGKDWDSDKGSRDQWVSWMRDVMREALRVLKPGAHALVWAIPRTSHWTATALEDAGFEIRDCLQHLFGSGFPKSHSCKNIGRPELGSALKPSCEFWWLVRKPLEKGLTIDKNVLRWGTGALEIDKSRITANRGSWVDEQILCDSCVSHVKKNAKQLIQETKGSIVAESVDSRAVVKRHGKLQGDISSVAIGCSEETSTANIKRNLNMYTSGKKLTDQNPKITSSTTLTKTNKTIDSKTCSSCGLAITDDCTAPNPTSTPTEVTPPCTENDGESSTQNSKQSMLLTNVGEEQKGRWPSHSLFSHNDDCVEVGVKKVQGAWSQKGQASDDFNASSYKLASPDRLDKSKYLDPDGTETVPTWECTEGCAVSLLDAQSGHLQGAGNKIGTPKKSGSHFTDKQTQTNMKYDNGGGASRFFYCAKSSKSERNAGCEGLPEKVSQSTGWSGDSMPLRQNGTERKMTHNQNTHPTVKPIKLMRYLIRLVTPPNGTVLDPFAGSGSTGVAAIQEGFQFIGIEREQEYINIAEKRMEHAECVV